MKDGHFIRVLGRRDVLALAFGAIVGWSWVLLTGEWVQTAGSLGAIAAFAIGGVAMVFIGLTYAELASAMPEVGGEHVYSYRALGAGASFVCTWSLILAYVTVVAFESVALSTGLAYLIPDFSFGRLWKVAGEDVYFSWIAVSVPTALVMTGVNVLGIKPAAVVQAIVTGIILLSGVLFVTGSLPAGDSANLQPLFRNGMTGTLSVLIMVPMMFIGFDVIPQAAEEIDLPRRLIGVLLVLSVLMALVWYVLMILGVALTFSATELDQVELATATANASVWGGQWAGNLMVIGGIAGIMTSWNAFLVGASRAVYALARSGMLPGWLGHLHPRFNTPYAAILLIGSFACISPLFGRQILIWLINAGGLAVIIAYGMVAVSFLVLRRREPDMPRPFRVAKGTVTGVAALVLSILLLLLYLPGSPAALTWPYEWLICLGWVALGAGFFVWARVSSH
ncbi:MAG: amino acid permease [Gammaproteobacteria bacterium]|nr:amino acid permease [Gammaproteobacteria bacterium]